jgi:hypothetical protein
VHTSEITEFKEEYRRHWKMHVGRVRADEMTPKVFKVSTENENKSTKTFETMEGLSRDVR